MSVSVARHLCASQAGESVIDIEERETPDSWDMRNQGEIRKHAV